MTGYTRFLVPLGLAAAAALANFAVFKRHTTKVELYVLKADIPEGTLITADHLNKIKVQGDTELFPSVLRPENLGEITDLPVRRDLKAGEVLLRADLKQPVLPLNTGEHSWTVRVLLTEAGKDLLPGDWVQVKVNLGNGNEARSFGPYRLCGWHPAEGKEERPRTRAYVLAVQNGDRGELQAEGWLDQGRDGGAIASLSRTTEPTVTRHNARATR
ncbi:MAG: SAF domain-containing protein [Gemmata sp.]